MPSPALDAEKARTPNEEGLHEVALPIDLVVNRDAAGLTARAIDAIMVYGVIKFPDKLSCKVSPS